MGYLITIKQTTREDVRTREYVQTGEDADGKATYGYATNEKTEDVERTIYTQQVDELVLVDVISAVNGYGAPAKPIKSKEGK
jgi:hypothetical protein